MTGVQRQRQMSHTLWGDRVSSESWRVTFSCIEASRNENDVWIELTTDWNNNGTKCSKVLSITKVGDC